MCQCTFVVISRWKFCSAQPLQLICLLKQTLDRLCFAASTLSVMPPRRKSQPPIKSAPPRPRKVASSAASTPSPALVVGKNKKAIPQLGQKKASSSLSHVPFSGSAAATSSASASSSSSPSAARLPASALHRKPSDSSDQATIPKGRPQN